MEVLKSIFVIFLVHCAVAEDALLKPCAVEDVPCLRQTTKTFLEKTHAGYSDYDIKPIDPIIINMVCTSAITGIMLHYTNVNITGLKNQDIEDFKLDKKTKSVLLGVTVEVNIDSDITLENLETKKEVSGKYTAKAKAELISKYNYELVTNEQGVEHFYVGPETVTCAADVKQVHLDAELQDKIKKDFVKPAQQEEYSKNRNSIEKNNICAIVKAAFVTVMHNIRASAKAFPKTAFFTNV